MSERKFIIWDVYLFINWICEIVLAHELNVIKKNLSMNFQSKTMKWYLTKLTVTKCMSLYSIDVWCDILMLQFVSLSINAIILIIHKYYICNNITNWHKSTVYLQTIIHHTITTHLSTSSVLVIVYQNINSELYHNLEKLISISFFIRILNSQKTIWFDLYSHHWWSLNQLSYQSLDQLTNQSSYKNKSQWNAHAIKTSKLTHFTSTNKS